MSASGHRLIALLMAMLFALLSVSLSMCKPLSAQAYGIKAVVEVGANGVVNVSISVALGEGLNAVPLPVEPLPPTILAAGDGRAVPTVYDNGTLYLILDRAMQVDVSYIANVSIANNIFHLNIVVDYIVEVRIPVDVVLLTWPEENIVDVDVAQEKLIMFVRGPTVLRYTLRLPHTLPVHPTPTEPQTPEKTPMQQELPAEPQIPLWLILLAVGGGTGSFVTGYLALRRLKRKRTVSTVIHELSDVDWEIIGALEAKGGSALQTELQEIVKVPKTTLWRHIRKLEKLGIVKIEKVGLQNRVTLIKRIKR